MADETWGLKICIYSAERQKSQNCYSAIFRWRVFLCTSISHLAKLFFVFVINRYRQNPVPRPSLQTKILKHGQWLVKSWRRKGNSSNSFHENGTIIHVMLGCFFCSWVGDFVDWKTQFSFSVHLSNSNRLRLPRIRQVRCYIGLPNSNVRRL